LFSINGSNQISFAREVIMKALPVIEGQPQKGQELEIIGGTGI
jgi:hypothetical protein